MTRAQAFATLRARFPIWERTRDDINFMIDAMVALGVLKLRRAR